MAVPVPQNGVIARPRLLDELGAGSKPITLVSAPAGYGKTTLLRQWAPDTGAVVRLDPAETPQRRELWQQVSDAFRLADVTVIIDDVHLLEGERSSRELGKALNRADQNRRLVIATRRDPILALRPAQLAGTVHEIRADELAFDEAETRLFLAANDITVTSEQAHAIWEHTEGWPAGLRLSTTPLSHAADSAEAFSSLLYGDTVVGSYLMGQALMYAPEPLRQFLLRTSVSEFLDAELAHRLSGRSDSALLLEQARSQPGFLSRFPGRRWPYRYHPMFRALLLAELTRSAPQDAQRLSAAAGAWFLAEGDYIRAAPLAAQGHAWGVLAEAILDGSCVALATGEWAWVRTEFARLPESLREANASLRLSLALMNLQTAATRDEAMTMVSALLRSQPSTNRREAEVLGFLKAWLLAEAGEAQQASRLLDVEQDDNSSWDSTPASQALRLALRQLHAACTFVIGSPGLEAMLDALAPSGTNVHPNIQLGELEIRTWAALVAGDLHAAQDSLDRASTILESESEDGRFDWALTFWSAWRWLELETGRRPPVTLPADWRSNHGRSVLPFRVGRALATITGARTRLLRDNDLRGSALMLDDLMSEQPEVRAWPTIGHLWTIARIEARLAAGEFSHALELPLQTGPDGFREGTDNESYLWAWVIQRAALAREPGPNSAEPGRLIGDLPIGSSLLPGRSEAVRIRVLLAAASLALRAGTPERASHYLRLALASTSVHHWRRPFEEIAPEIAPVLEAERHRISTYGELVVELLHQLRRQPGLSGQLLEPLSVRELEILHFLPTQLDQRELCSTLFISRNTLKTHLRSTYRKLGVQTRREAVLTAERLGIL
jgi:LuxR family maltose regulon positive regulatory protein